MGTTTSKESITWFDLLPTEIILMIFDYLSNNDIIYTFFYFNQRFKNLSLQNKHYLTHIELPTTNLNTWKKILSIIRFQIQSLNINSIDLSFPLTYFPNLKSINISSSYGYPKEQLKLIFESKYFTKLHSFKVKANSIYSDRSIDHYLINSNYVLKNVFIRKSSLKTFHYSLSVILTTHLTSYETNLNLRSLKLILIHFQDIFTLISYTPNLEYLNIQCQPPYSYQNSINKTNIKLKQMYLTLMNRGTSRIDSNCLINDIKQFSSTLTCLSLNLGGITFETDDDIPLNSLKLQQFLELMTELKQFHFYAKLNQYLLSNHMILSRFKTQYWFDHNWSFGMHGKYFYTLPFHFDYLREFPDDFYDVESNNPEILLINPQLWYNVKCIHLRDTSKYDSNFLKQLKMKMPKLTFIKFGPFLDYGVQRIEDWHMNIDERETGDVILNSVTSIKCTGAYFEDIKGLLIDTLPNVNRLILSSIDLPSTDTQLAEIFNKRIERLDIDANSKLVQLTEMSYVYFSNVKHIYFHSFYSSFERPKWFGNIVWNILKNFKSLQTLLIILDFKLYQKDASFITRDMSTPIERSDIEKIKKNYQIKRFGDYILFSKEECGDGKNPNGTLLSNWRKFSCIHRQNDNRMRKTAMLNTDFFSVISSDFHYRKSVEFIK